MSPELAGAILAACGAYMAFGCVFALAFVTFGAQRIDPDARGMPLSARCLIAPGAALLWPLMAFKWSTQKAPPIQ